jgi:alkylated DNA repair dioxygenase AlkB
MLIQVKGIVEDYSKQKINHMIITKYDQPEDCIGWHNDKVQTIADDSVIAVISLGACRRFQLRLTPTDKDNNPPVLKEIIIWFLHWYVFRGE